MKLLLNLITDVEVVSVAGDGTIKPDWEKALAELSKWEGVKRATVELADEGEGYWHYIVTLLVNARRFAGEETWRMCRQQFKGDGEPIEAAAITESFLSDEGGWDAPFHDAVAPHLPGYMLTVSEPPEIDEAQP